MTNTMMISERRLFYFPLHDKLTFQKESCVRNGRIKDKHEAVCMASSGWVYMRLIHFKYKTGEIFPEKVAKSSTGKQTSANARENVIDSLYCKNSYYWDT